MLIILVARNEKEIEGTTPILIRPANTLPNTYRTEIIQITLIISEVRASKNEFQRGRLSSMVA